MDQKRRQDAEEDQPNAKRQDTKQEAKGKQSWRDVEEDIFRRESWPDASLLREQDLPPNSLTVELKKHQKQGLWWMMARERKTLISQEEASKMTKEQMSEHLARADACPPIYKSYFYQATTPHNQTVVRRGHRHVVTESEVHATGNWFGGLVADDMGTGKTLQFIALILATKPAARIWAAEDPKRTRATLIVAPANLVGRVWETELKDRVVAGNLEADTFRGTGVPQMLRCRRDVDVALTTYETLRSYKKDFQEVRWWRIVADEAHRMRNPTNTTRASLDIPSERRWALTGTPLQNSLTDLASIVAFLGVPELNDPGNANFRKYILTPLEAKGLSQEAADRALGKLQGLLQCCMLRRKKPNGDAEQRRVELCLSPEQQQLHDILRKHARDTLEQELEKGQFKAITLIGQARRLVAGGPRLLSHATRKFCAAHIANSSPGPGPPQGHAGTSAETAIEIIDTNKPTEAEAYDIFEIQADRSCCRCGGEVAADAGAEGENFANARVDGATQPFIAYVSSCKHIWCPTCATDLDKTAKAPVAGLGNCLECDSLRRSSGLTGFSAERPEAINGQAGDVDLPGDDDRAVKVEAVAADLERIQQANEHPTRQALPDQVVVFSEWIGTINALETALSARHVRYQTYHGRKTERAKSLAMTTFIKDKKVTALLITTGTGNEGLNLQNANWVMLMEPGWNPAVEEQATNRLQRLGQERQVHVVRYICRDTIETRVEERQRKKRALAELTLKKSAGKLYKSPLGIEDLREVLR